MLVFTNPTGVINYLPILFGAAFLLHQTYIVKETTIWTSAIIALPTIISILLLVPNESSILIPVVSLIVVASFVGFEWKYSGKINFAASGVMVWVIALLAPMSRSEPPVLILYSLILIAQLLKNYIDKENHVVTMIFSTLVVLTGFEVESYYTLILLGIIGLLSISIENTWENISGISLVYTVVVFFVGLNNYNSEYLVVSALLIGISMVHYVNSKKDLVIQNFLYTVSSIFFLIIFNQILGVLDYEYSYLIVSLLSIPSLLMLSTITWIQNNNYRSRISILFVALSVLFIPRGATLIPLVLFAGNLFYALLQTFNKSKLLDPIIMGGYGLALIVLGAILGNDEYIWYLLPQYTNLLNYIWLVQLVIWLVTLNIEISGKGMTIGGINENIADITMQEETDLITATLTIFALVSLTWTRMIYFSSIFWLVSMVSIGILVVVAINKNVSFNKSSNTSIFIFSLIFYLIASINMFSVPNLYPLLGMKVSNHIYLLSWLPIALGFFIASFRSFGKNIGDLTIAGSLGSILVAFLPVILSDIDVLEIYPSLFISIISLLLLNTQVGKNSVGTVLSTIALYMLTFFMGGHLPGITDNGTTVLIGTLYASLLLGIIIYLYSMYLQRKNLGNETDNYMLYNSVILQLIASLIFSEFNLLQYTNPLTSAMITIYLSTVGTLVYLYGTKMGIDRFNTIGMVVIFGNLFRGAAITLIRDTGGAVSVYTLLSYLWLVITIFLVVGVRSIANAEEMDNFLRRMFLPTQKEEE